ncbi:hypothetical protein IKF15_04440 [Candidatus Saccharibacteria bacterium]|nr:hypothetical protein [Candidatus Saccharibacteria bacterium]
MTEEDLEKEITRIARGFSEVTECEDKEGRRIFRRKASLEDEGDGKIFLVVWKGKRPLRLEMRCDRRLGQVLQERYESVMQSRALARNGIEVICSGQLSDDEIVDLVRHSYELSLE